MTIITKGLFEQHFHGCYGIDFNKASVDEVLFLAKKMFERGITVITPTIATDDLGNMQKQIKIIEKAKELLTEDCACIFGVHLEGPFLNPQKKGAHQEIFLKEPNIDDYKKYLDNPLVKIVTIAPEKDKNNELSAYLREKGVKISAGHCIGSDLSCVNQVTHLFNAMDGLHHRNKTTSLEALKNDNIFVEIIGDCEHVQSDILKFVFKLKNMNKILLISDSAPLAKSDKKQMDFLGETIYKSSDKLVGKNGTIAGSALLLDDIVRKLVNNKIVSFDEAVQMASLNQRMYHNFDDTSIVEWNEDYTVKKVQRVLA